MSLIRNKRKGNISKSGAITISPKNQLVEIDNQQGQIPIDLSIDGRQLLDTKNHFSDNYLNYNFNSQYSNLKGPSVGFPDNDINQNFFISTPNTLGADYFSSHRVSKNSLKDVRLKRSLNKKLGAFKEDDLINLNSQESFYLTSSNPDIIKNFDQPIKDRNVINIDLESPSRGVEYNSESISTMLYYNFANNDWDLLTSDSPDDIMDDDKINARDLRIGFSPSLFGQGIVSIGDSSGFVLNEYMSGSISEPISNFGFPSTSKYEASESQLLSMKKYIDKPFLLEKVIITTNFLVSGRKHVNDTNLLPFSVGNNFFILNQKSLKGNRLFNNLSEIPNSYVQATEVDDFSGEVFYTRDNVLYNTEFKPPIGINPNDLGYAGSLEELSSMREIVTYSKIVFVTTGSHDLNAVNTSYDFNKLEQEADYYKYVSSSGLDCDFTFNGKIVVESPVRAANKNAYISKFSDIYVGNQFGSRTLLGEDFNKSFYRNNDSYSVQISEYGVSSDYKYSVLQNPNRNSPYVLMPDDNLIFGFQSLSNMLGNHSNSAYIGGNKVSIKLIGTPLSGYMPKKEIRREFQTSNNLRSSIIGNTYLSDQFETGPIQLYAKSSIDRIVTSDSSRDLGRSLSTFYSNGDKGTNKKAVLVTNTDINNIYEDSALSKNSLKYYFNWRRYGHLSDFISQAKNSANVRIKNSRINYVVEKKYFNVTTGIPSVSSVSSNSDTYSRITLPFIED